MDSGACLSVVHESMLRQCEFEFTGTRGKEYSGAGGHRLPLLDQVADVKVHVDKLGWVVFRNVLVLRKETRLQTTMLVGRYDLQRLKIVLDFTKGVMITGDRDGHRKIKMVKRVSTAVARVKASPSKKLVPTTDAVALVPQLVNPGKVITSTWQEDPNFNNQTTVFAAAINKQYGDVVYEDDVVGMVTEEDPEGLQQSHVVPSDGWSTRATLGDPCHFVDPCCSGCDECIDSKISEWIKRNGVAPSLDDLNSDDERSKVTCKSVKDAGHARYTFIRIVTGV